MLEQVEIVEKFQALLEMEKQAEQHYAQLAQQIADDTLRQQFEQLRRDKLKHIRLIERLLEILE